MRKILILILVSLSIVVLVIRFGTNPIMSLLGIKQRAGIKIDSNLQATVNIDNQPVGNTPLEKDDLTSGEHLVQLLSAAGNWQGYVQLNPGTLSVINRELSPTEASSSGEIITLAKGSGVIVTSSPTGADVQVDGNVIGKTPLDLNSLSLGEHLFALSHADYLTRSIRVALTDGYQLTLNVDLAVSKADLSQTSTPALPVNVTLKVTSTPTGFLRVRDTPSLNGVEIDRVNTGDTLTLIDEEGSWDKVKVADGKEGYVSAQYVQKQSSP